MIHVIVLGPALVYFLDKVWPALFSLTGNRPLLIGLGRSPPDIC